MFFLLKKLFREEVGGGDISSRQEEITTMGDMHKARLYFAQNNFCGKRRFQSKTKRKKDFLRSQKFKIFTWEISNWALENERIGCFRGIATCSVSPCISMHPLHVCGGLIVHAALSGSRIEASAKSARRASASTHEMCLTHSVLCRRHSPMVVQSLTRRSFENFGAIFNDNGFLSFHLCSDPVPGGTVLIFAPWMPSPSRSTVSSTTFGSLARPAPSCTTEWL